MKAYLARRFARRPPRKDQPPLTEPRARGHCLDEPCASRRSPSSKERPPCVDASSRWPLSSDEKRPNLGFLVLPTTQRGARVCAVFRTIHVDASSPMARDPAANSRPNSRFLVLSTTNEARASAVHRCFTVTTRVSSGEAATQLGIFSRCRRATTRARLRGVQLLRIDASSNGASSSGATATQLGIFSYCRRATTRAHRPRRPHDVQHPSASMLHRHRLLFTMRPPPNLSRRPHYVQRPSASCFIGTVCSSR
jgi:hypothetical protein